jgi:hypothetical protein
VTSEILILVHKTLGLFAIFVTSAGVLAVVDFSQTITLGSILIAFIILVVSGVFTVRSRIATIWRQEAEGERAAKERLEEELADERVSRVEFEKQQQELRHDLKDQISGLKSQLKVMEARTDLTAALETIQKINEHTTESIVDAMHKTSMLSEQRDGATHKLLEEIRDKLPSEPIAVHDITNE